MKALVVGGTGPTGPLIVQGLLDRGYEVTVYHRGFHVSAMSPTTFPKSMATYTATPSPKRPLKKT